MAEESGPPKKPLWKAIAEAIEMEAKFKHHMTKGYQVALERLKGQGFLPSQTNAEPVFCQVISNNGISECDRVAYEDLVRSASDFMLFIDGIKNTATCLESDGSIRNSHLRQAEVVILAKYMITGQRMTPFRAIDSQTASGEAARKLFERARRKVDVKVARYKWRAFEICRASESGLTQYQFAPPEGFSYCLIMPIGSKRGD